MHAAFREGVDLHMQAHRMADDDYAAAIQDLLGVTENEAVPLSEGLGFLINAMHQRPLCLAHTAFLAGVLYGRDTQARDIPR